MMHQITPEQLREMMTRAQQIRQNQKVCIDINHLVKIGPPPYAKQEKERIDD